MELLKRLDGIDPGADRVTLALTSDIHHHSSVNHTSTCNIGVAAKLPKAQQRAQEVLQPDLWADLGDVITRDNETRDATHARDVSSVYQPDIRIPGNHDMVRLTGNFHMAVHNGLPYHSYAFIAGRVLFLCPVPIYCELGRTEKGFHFMRQVEADGLIELANSKREEFDRVIVLSHVNHSRHIGSDKKREKLPHTFEEAGLGYVLVRSFLDQFAGEVMTPELWLHGHKHPSQTYRQMKGQADIMRVGLMSFSHARDPDSDKPAGNTYSLSLSPEGVVLARHALLTKGWQEPSEVFDFKTSVPVSKAEMLEANKEQAGNVPEAA